MARYEQASKDRAVVRLLPPESSAVNAMAQAVGVSASTLERWRAQAQAEGQQSEGWTAVAKLNSVVTTTAISEAERSVWYRSKWLSSGELVQWPQAATGALERPAETVSRASSAPKRRRVRELQRELSHKEKALPEAAALLVLSKKFEAISHKDADA